MTRLLVLSTIFLLAIPAMAAVPPCLTFKQARAAYPISYLKYHVEGRKPGGRHCWFAPGLGKLKSERKVTPTRRYTQRTDPQPRPAPMLDGASELPLITIRWAEFGEVAPDLIRGMGIELLKRKYVSLR